MDRLGRAQPRTAPPGTAQPRPALHCSARPAPPRTAPPLPAACDTPGPQRPQLTGHQRAPTRPAVEF